MPSSIGIARQALIDNFQSSLRSLRLLMGFSVANIAQFVGVDRHIIDDLEIGKSRMSAVQFLALCAVVDNYISSDEEKYQAVGDVLDAGKCVTDDFGSSFSGYSLLRRWFLLSEEQEENGVEILPDCGSVLDETQIRLLVQDCRIFLDDTAFLVEMADVFLHSLESCLIEEDRKLIIPFRSVEQLHQRTRNPETADKAVRALQLLKWMQEKKLVQIRGEENDSNLSDTILSVFLKFRKTYRLCLITQNAALADKVLQLNEINDQLGFEVSVGYIRDDGQLSLYTGENQDDAEFEDAISVPWTEID